MFTVVVFETPPSELGYRAPSEFEFALRAARNAAARPLATPLAIRKSVV